MNDFVYDANIAEDPSFDEQLKDLIREVEEKYKKVKEGAKTGIKASPIVRLKEEGLLTIEFIKAEFPKIANKQSSLPKGKRDAIDWLVFNAAQRTVLIKRAKREREILEKANAPKE